MCILPMNNRKQRIPNLALSFTRNKPIKFDHVCDHGEIVQKILVISVFNFEQQAYLSKVVSTVRRTSAAKRLVVQNYQKLKQWSLIPF